MKKYIISGVVILAFVFYVAYQKGAFKDLLANDDKVNVVPPASLQGNSSNSAGSETTNPAAGGTPYPTPTYPTPAVSAQYKDGSYTGTVADAFYGPLQVQAIISGGKIIDVTFLQSPNDRGTSIEVNTQAMPYLKAEAIQVQNSNVDIVSGATQSSEAFRISLAAALAKAK